MEGLSYSCSDGMISRMNCSFVRELLSTRKRYFFTSQVGGGVRLKRQRSEKSSFLADAAGSKAEPDREKNQLVKEEHRLIFSPRESWRSEHQEEKWLE